MENGAFALKDNIFKCMIFQMHQKALYWSKGILIDASKQP